MQDIYKKAVFNGLRFKHNGSTLTVEHLTKLSEQQLSDIFIELNQQASQASQEGLLVTNSSKKVSEELQLKLAIVKDIFDTLQAEQKSAKDLSEKKAELAFLQEQKAAKLLRDAKKLSVDDLDSKIKELEQEIS